MVVGELERSSEVVVIGGGPGGYAAAFRAAELGLEVTLVDPAPRPGGRCLHHGCISAKSLLYLARVMHDAGRTHAMGITYERPRIDLNALRRWRDRVIDRLADQLVAQCRGRDIQLVRALAQFEGPQSVRLHGEEAGRIRFEHAVVATGARPTPLPGMTFEPGGRIMDPGAALALVDIPERLLIVGGGYIGLELGTIFSSLGSRVTLAAATDRLLPGVDPDLVSTLRPRLDSVFESILLQTRVGALQESGNRLEATLEGVQNRTDFFDRCIVAAGSRPHTEALGLENTGADLDDRGFIQVDHQQRTDDRHILAVGDATAGPMLAHRALRQGKVAAETIAGKPSGYDVQAFPFVVHTIPQIAWCGVTQEAARRQGREIIVRRFPWKRSERAATMGLSEGLTKLIVDPGSSRLIGAGIAGHQAESLIAEAVLAIEMGALAEDIALSLHPYPTLSETAAAAAEGFDQDL